MVRGAVLAAHAAAGAVASFGQCKEAEKMARAAEGLLRAAAGLLATPASSTAGPVSAAGSGGSHAAANAGSGMSKSALRRRRRVAAAAAAVSTELHQDKQAEGMEVEEPTGEPASTLAILPANINLCNIVDSGEAAVRNFLVAELRRRRVPSTVSGVIADQSVQLLLDLRSATKGKEGYDGLRFQEGVGKLLDKIVKSVDLPGE